MPSPLSPDATLKDLRLARSDAAQFVRNALDVMRKAKKDHGPVVARMGVTGTGVEPNYRIEGQSGQPLFAINGANHDRWPEEAAFEGKENWSTASMTFSEVEDLLRSLTGYEGK